MKKLFLVFFILFFSTPFFAENTFNIFSSDASAKDVIDFFLENNWKISLDKSKTRLDCEPVDTWNYYNYEIVKISFTFTPEGFLQTQSIGLGNPPLSLTEAYKVLMDIACKDKTTFLNVKYFDTGTSGNGIAYYTKTPDFNACVHMIVGIEEKFCVSILYGNAF